MVSSITIANLLPKIDSINIIDIRSIISYNNNHIPTAINIPQDKLLTEPTKYLQKDKTYYLYCQKGISSVKVCNILNIKGFNVINIAGGYEGWVLEK